jgi:hypothetical protein
MDERDKHDTDNREPPAGYFPACGVLCDVFWWARRPQSVKQASPAGETQPARDPK